MHEVDMTKALMITLEDWWRSQPGSPVISKVHLQVGEFTCVEPLSLEFAFTAQSQGTFLQGAELVIESVPFVAHCLRCQQDYHPQMGEQYACPTCRDPLTEIVSGRELRIKSLECEDPCIK